MVITVHVPSFKSVHMSDGESSYDENYTPNIANYLGGGSKIRQSPFIIYPSVNCCHFNPPTEGNLFPLREAWVGLFTPGKYDVFYSKRPSLHSE